MDVHAPALSDELVVHKKKVEEARAWLVDALANDTKPGSYKAVSHVATCILAGLVASPLPTSKRTSAVRTAGAKAACRCATTMRTAPAPLLSY